MVIGQSCYHLRLLLKWLHMWNPCCKLFYIKIGSEDFKSRFSIEFYKEDRYIFGGNIFFKEMHLE